MAITEVKSKDEFKVTGNWNEQAKMLKEKVNTLVDGYVDEVNTHAPGAVPAHMIDPIRMEATSAIP